jgi:hypothetical protein
MALAAVACIDAMGAGVAPPGDAEAQKAHAQGSCGSMGPGSGLKDGKGWIVSMLPGKHEFRVRGGGVAYLTVARKTELDVDPGRPYYIVLEKAPADAQLEWRIMGGPWAPVSKYFLYPPKS